MDVKAILITGVQQPGVQSGGGAPEFVAGAPIATLDVLGSPLVVRVAEQLLAGGVSSVAIVSDADASCPAALRRDAARANVRFISAGGAQLWRECESIFQEFTDAELVIVWRMGAYAELDLGELVQAHIHQRSRVTQVCDPAGEGLGIFAISGSRRNDAAFLFRHNLQESRTPCSTYAAHGYSNRLRTAADLRRLTVDALHLRNRIHPIGREIKPGVWLGRGARIQKGARVLAPGYIGPYSLVRTSAVLTRCSVVEQHSQIDCGSMIEDSTILPFTYVGAGLDACHSIVGNRRLLSLRRNVEVEITDPRLSGMVSENAGVRTAVSMGALFSFLPRQIFRGVFAKSHREPPSLPEAVQTPSAALRETGTLQPSPDATQFPANMAVARRYGNE